MNHCAQYSRPGQSEWLVHSPETLTLTVVGMESSLPSFAVTVHVQVPADVSVPRYVLVNDVWFVVWTALPLPSLHTKV